MKTAIRPNLWALIIIAVSVSGCGDTDHSQDASAGTVDEHSDEHDGEADGHIELTPAQLEAAGIRTVTVGPSSIETLLELSAVVDVDLDAQAHVNPRVGGLVRTVHAQLGQTVQRGDPLCSIDSVELGRAVGDYLSDEATVTATLDTLQRERDLLARQVKLAQEVFERERDLVEREITTLASRYEAEAALQDAQLRHDARLLELEARLARERIALVAAERELEILGLTHAEVEALPAAANAAHEPFGTYLIRAPRDGVIVARNVTESEYVGPDSRLFKIQDLQTVWVLAAAYERDLASVHIGTQAYVDLDAFPGTTFEGRVDFIDYRIDATTRTTTLRIELKNESIDDWPESLPLRPGMYGRVGIVTGSVEAAITVPESALVHEADGDVVFVAVAPGVFEDRPVRTGAMSPDAVEIIAGLTAGERVAVSGTFTLKSVARAGELGGGHSH